MRFLPSVYKHISPFQSRSLTTNLSLTFALGCILAAGIPIHALPATTVTLSVTSGGGAVTTVSSGTVITLTATVKAGTTPVTPGQVDFCDAAAAHCLDIHLLATAQLTHTGTATYKFRPGGGTHSYKAIFKGTTTYASSTSATAALSVTGPFPTATTISPAAAGGTWTLTASVYGKVSSAGLTAPTGTVSFLDTSNSNTELATVPLVQNAVEPSFSSPLLLEGGGGNVRVIAADFNGDGILDLLEVGGDAVETRLGVGDGTFTAATGTSLGSNFSANFAAVGDFNGDGIPDLAITNTSVSNILILIGKGDGTFTLMATVSTGSDPRTNLNYIVVGDFNLDGIQDLAITDEFSDTVAILQGTGDGNFTLKESLLTGTTPISIVAADFNGDGIPDLAVEYVNDIAILLGKGDGTFSVVNNIAGSYLSPIAQGDFNGDGSPDLALVSSSGDAVSILLGKGNGSFTASSAPLPPQYFYTGPLAVADFNEDGNADLLSGGGESVLMLGNGDGTFSTVFTTNPASFLSVAVGDFNGDGYPDVFASGLFSAGTVLTQAGRTATATATNVSFASLGTHLVEATYPGDTHYNPSISGATALAVQASALMSPAPGSTLTSFTTTFSWTAGSGVEDYRLSLGTKGVGSSNIYAGNPTTAVSATVSSLPTTGVTIYARLSSLIGGTWQAVDYTYIAEGPGPPALVSPYPGNPLDENVVVFVWTSGNRGTFYQFWVGLGGVGSSDVYNSGTTTSTQATVGLPGLALQPQATLYVRLLWNVSGTWQFSDYTYTGPLGFAAPIYPDPGTQLPGSTVIFNWYTGGFASGCCTLSLGTTGKGSDNLYQGNFTNDMGQSFLSATVTGLPADGVTIIYGELDTAAGTFYFNYLAAASPAAAITSPLPGSALTGSTVTFQWVPGSQPATMYGLYLATNWPGGANLGSVFDTTATQATFSGLPTNGVIIYARLWSLINGGWQYRDITYTADGTIAPAVLTSPTPGSHLTGPDLTFQWTPGSGVTMYRLYLATNWVGGANLGSVFDTTATQAAFSNLPTSGVTIYARLWSLINGGWQYLDYTYTANGTLTPAMLTSPAPGSHLTGPDLTFQWTPGSGVTLYRLYLATDWPGGANLGSAFDTTATQATFSGLPTNGVTIYARLWSQIENVWQYTDYTYTAFKAP